MYDDLSRMPATQAAGLVTGQIRTVLPQYNKMFEESWAKVVEGRKNAPSGVPTTVGPTLTTTNNADHSPTLAGARLQVLSLLLVAGNLRLQETHEVAMSVAEEARRQRDRFYAETRGDLDDRYYMLCNAGLYNRRLIATTLLGTSTAFSAADAPDAESWETQRLTKYDADSTPYDFITREGGDVPADFSKGEILVKTHKSIDDASFDAILKAVAR